MSSLSLHGLSSPETFHCERVLCQCFCELLTDDRKGPRLFLKEKASPEQLCHALPLLLASPAQLVLLNVLQFPSCSPSSPPSQEGPGEQSPAQPMNFRVHKLSCLHSALPQYSLWYFRLPLLSYREARCKPKNVFSWPFGFLIFFSLLPRNLSPGQNYWPVGWNLLNLNNPHFAKGNSLVSNFLFLGGSWINPILSLSMS